MRVRYLFFVRGRETGSSAFVAGHNDLEVLEMKVKIPKILRGRRYKFRVQASNIGGVSDWGYADGDLELPEVPKLGRYTRGKMKVKDIVMAKGAAGLAKAAGLDDIRWKLVEKYTMPNWAKKKKKRRFDEKWLQEHYDKKRAEQAFVDMILGREAHRLALKKKRQKEHTMKKKEERLISERNTKILRKRQDKQIQRAYQNQSERLDLFERTGWQRATDAQDKKDTAARDAAEQAERDELQRIKDDRRGRRDGRRRRAQDIDAMYEGSVLMAARLGMLERQAPMRNIKIDGTPPTPIVEIVDADQGPLSDGEDGVVRRIMLGDGDESEEGEEDDAAAVAERKRKDNEEAAARAASPELRLYWRPDDTGAYQFDEENLWNIAMYLTKFPTAQDASKRFPTLFSTGKMVMKGFALDKKGARWLGIAWEKGALVRIHELRLNYNQLRDPGAVGLARGLQHGRTTDLVELHLAGNAIGATGMASLAKAFKSKSGKDVACPKLELLDVSKNNLRNEGARELAHVLFFEGLPSLVKIDMRANSIRDTGLGAMIKSLCATLKDGSVVCQRDCFQTLNLRLNHPSVKLLRYWSKWWPGFLCI